MERKETTALTEHNMGASALMLPDPAQFQRDLRAIRQFQAIAKAELIQGHDYGVIPGTPRPTLLKPGAEKISKILGLADSYEIIERQEDWDKPFFRYLIRCRLTHAMTGVEISQGLGECNSYESRYRYRWLTRDKLPTDVNSDDLPKQMRRSKTGGQFAVYRLDNDDIYSQVNTLIKMSKKRALVDAALSAGRLSDVFTQDIEELPSLDDDPYGAAHESPQPPTKPERAKATQRPVEPLAAKPQPDDAAYQEMVAMFNDLNWDQYKRLEWVKNALGGRRWEDLTEGQKWPVVNRLKAENFPEEQPAEGQDVTPEEPEQQAELV